MELIGKMILGFIFGAILGFIIAHCEWYIKKQFKK